MDLEERIADGCFLPIFIGSARIALLSYSYRTVTYKFPLLDLCGKTPVELIKPFILVLNGITVSQNSCVFTFSVSV